MNEKYENSIKLLKYHKDPFQRKLMTKEEIDFLLRLQKEMNTQDSLGNRDPRYWVIRNWDKAYGKNLNNSDGILVFDNTSGETICDIPNAEFDSKTAEICSSKIIELINERLTEKLDKAATEDIEDKIRTASIVSSIEDVITEICDEYSLDVEVTDYEYYPSDSGMFLTHKAALEHLRDNDYHDTDEESDFSELSVVVEKEWLFHFVKAKFDFKTDEEVRKYLQEEYTSDDSSEWYDEAIAANKVVMVNFN